MSGFQEEKTEKGRFAVLLAQEVDQGGGVDFVPLPGGQGIIGFIQLIRGDVGLSDTYAPISMTLSKWTFA